DARAAWRLLSARSEGSERGDPDRGEDSRRAGGQHRGAAHHGDPEPRAERLICVDDTSTTRAREVVERVYRCESRRVLATPMRLRPRSTTNHSKTTGCGSSSPAATRR